MTDKLDREQKLELLELLEEKKRRAEENKLNTLFPSEGPYRRDLYPKQLEFFKAGRFFKERAFIAGNRSGKTVAGCYELVLHLTGLYPDWWEGKRFNTPIQAWAASETNETTRDILQAQLLGKRGEYGTGVIPKECIKRTTSRPGIPDAVQDVYVRHITGGTSVLGFKSYVQGIESFMGTERHVVFFDEEPPPKIWSEAITRTMTTHGIIYATFTPLQGLSDVVLSFLPGGKFPKDQVSLEEVEQNG